MFDKDLPFAIFLMGPTASGKTELAMQLIEALPFEIISVDSAMIYRGLDIGTAKPTQDELSRAPHRLIDILDPVESYSVAQFRIDALRHMNHISHSGRIPLLVGGTMMYFRALQNGLAVLPEADPAIRSYLDRLRAEKGLEKMHQILAEVDPESADRIHPNDPQRILRALEVFLVGGESMTELQARAKTQPLPFNVLKLVLSTDRSILHERIAWRFKDMLAKGFVKEVEQLHQRDDLGLEKPSMRAVGYRQVWNYLDGECQYDEMLEAGIVATRQLAKRQLTWLRSEQNATWFDSNSLNTMEVIDIIGKNLGCN